jgi:hypothetical protein
MNDRLWPKAAAKLELRITAANDPKRTFYVNPKVELFK